MIQIPFHRAGAARVDWSKNYNIAECALNNKDIPLSTHYLYSLSAGLPRHNLSDDMDPGEHAAKKSHYIFDFGRPYDYYESNPVIENMVHFFRRNIALFAKEVEDGRYAPGIPPYERLAGARQNPLDIVVETTPGDVSHPMNPVLAQKLQNGFDIDVGGFEKFLANGSVQFRNEAVGF
jgi:hypothetical protein